MAVRGLARPDTPVPLSATGVQPDSGRLTAYRSPGGHGVRLDGGMAAGNVVSRHYDSLVSPQQASVIFLGGQLWLPCGAIFPHLTQVWLGPNCPHMTYTICLPWCLGRLQPPSHCKPRHAQAARLVACAA